MSESTAFETKTFLLTAFCTNLFYSPNFLFFHKIYNQAKSIHSVFTCIFLKIL